MMDKAIWNFQSLEKKKEKKRKQQINAVLN